MNLKTLEGTKRLSMRNGYTMSIKNKVLWRKLGGPTTGEFAALCYLPHVPIECGFQMCFIGEVWQRNMLDGTTDGLQK